MRTDLFACAYLEIYWPSGTKLPRDSDLQQSPIKKKTTVYVCLLFPFIILPLFFSLFSKNNKLNYILTLFYAVLYMI